jgi:hypothetical protein
LPKGSYSIGKILIGKKNSFILIGKKTLNWQKDLIIQLAKKPFLVFEMLEQFKRRLCSWVESIRPPSEWVTRTKVNFNLNYKI